MSRIVALLFLAAIISLEACKPEEPPGPPDTEEPVYYHTYAPLDSGMYWIYNGDSIKWRNRIPEPDTALFQIKELITGQVPNATGGKSWRIERYMREDSLQPWRLSHVFTAERGLTEFTRTVNNKRLLKMVFPIKQGHTWNANVYTTQDSLGWDTAKYVGVHEPFQLNSKMFDSTVNVSYRNYQDFITDARLKERYANHIGLIYHEEVDLNIQSSGNDGYEVHWWLQEHGKE